MGALQKISELSSRFSGHFPKEVFWNMIYPPSCAVCSEPIDKYHAIASLCYSCWDKLDFCGGTACSRCAEPIEALESNAVHIPKDPVCSNCQANPPLFDKARSVFFYNEVAAALIMGFKHADRTELRFLLAQWLAGRVGDWVEEADYIIPVPLHYLRLLGRRYNQAQLLAEVLCRWHNAEHKLIPDMLVRNRYTRSMKRMTYRQRYENLRRSIAVNPKWSDKLAGKVILVIDDVHTGGATFSASAAALRKAKAEKIYVASIARVLLG